MKLKKLIFAIGLLAITALSAFAQLPDTIAIGSSANDGTGDTFRGAFVKVNSNDQWLDENKIDVSDGVTQASELYQLLDTIPAYVFGAGAGLAGDTALFLKDAHGFGVFNTKNDTTVCLVDLVRISAGDSITFNIYWGNAMTLTATDSLFDAPEPVGVNQGSLTVDDAKIPPNQDVWVELRADQVLTATPNEVIIQLSKQIIRD